MKNMALRSGTHQFILPDGLGGFNNLRSEVGCAEYVTGLLQLTAFLEVLHSALGLVHSSTLYNFLQWLGRSHVLFAIIAQIPEVQEQPPILITFSAWALSEVIRCPYYALTLMGMCPRWLTWLRYFLLPCSVIGPIKLFAAYLED
jgi:hypothetical protein